MFTKTIQYLKKAIVLLLIVFIAPAILLSLFVTPFSNLTFLPDFYMLSTPKPSFFDIFLMNFNLPSGNPWIVILFIVIGFLSLIICCAYGASIIEKHFKTGKLSLRVPVGQFLSFLGPALISITVAGIATLLLLFIQSGLISILANIDVSVPPSAIICIVATIFALAIFAVIIALIIPLFYTPITMVLYGYSFTESAVESLRMTAQKFNQLFWSLIIPMLCVSVLTYVINLVITLPGVAANLTEQNSYTIKFVISVFLHLVTMCYLMAFMMVTYFEISGMERRDLNKTWRRGNEL